MGDGIVKPRLLFANNAGVGLFDPVGRAFGYAYSNGDVSPDARGDVRTVARDGGAVLRADDGHLRAFRSADRRALDDDIRAWRRRGTPPPPPLDPSPAHNSTHYNQGLRASGL